MPLNLLDLKISRHFSHQPRLKKQNKNEFGPHLLLFVSPALRRQRLFVLRCDMPIKLSASCDVQISLLDVGVRGTGILWCEFCILFFVF